MKSNVGHLDTAAGIAGLLKTVLAVSRGKIPPMLNFHTPNPALKLEESPFTVPVTAQEWQDEVRYAGVSSFGIGGTNCHMIVASLPDELNISYPAADDGSKSSALLLSAASDTALRQLAADYAAALRENADANNLAFTALRARRLDLPFRLAAPLNHDTAAALSAWAGAKSTSPVYSASRRQRQTGVAVYRAGFTLAHYGPVSVPALNGVCRYAGALFCRLSRHAHAFATGSDV